VHVNESKVLVPAAVARLPGIRSHRPQLKQRIAAESYRFGAEGSGARLPPGSLVRRPRNTGITTACRLHRRAVGISGGVSLPRQRVLWEHDLALGRG